MKGCHFYSREMGYRQRALLTVQKSTLKGTIEGSVRKLVASLSRLNHILLGKMLQRMLPVNLKKGAGRKMIKKRSPKKLWDDCLELEGYIRSNTAHDIFMLNGEVPETIMSGETSDISQFCEFEWYDWVYF